MIQRTFGISTTESRVIKYVYTFEDGAMETRTVELEPMDFDVSVNDEVSWYLARHRPDLNDGADAAVFVNYRDNSLAAFLFSGGDE